MRSLLGMQSPKKLNDHYLFIRIYTLILVTLYSQSADTLNIVLNIAFAKQFTANYL